MLLASNMTVRINSSFASLLVRGLVELLTIGRMNSSSACFGGYAEILLSSCDLLVHFNSVICLYPNINLVSSLDVMIISLANETITYSNYLMSLADERV